MLARDAGRLTFNEENLLRENVLHKLNTTAIYQQEAEKHDMSIRDRLEQLKSEQERTKEYSPAPAAESSQAPSYPPSSTTPVIHPTGPTPYLRQRLPEAVEAERRRTASPTDSAPPESAPPASP